MPNYNYLLPTSLSAPAPTNALAQPRMVNYGALAVNQQAAPGSDDAIYQMFQSLAKQGAANRGKSIAPLSVGVGQYDTYSTEGNLPHNQRKPIVHPDGVVQYNPLTKEEEDLVKHPSVLWMKKRGEESRRQFLAEIEPHLGKEYKLPNDWETAPDRFGKSVIENLPNRIDPEFAHHARIIGELAKRNPEVYYASGMLDDLVDRSVPGQFGTVQMQPLSNPRY